MREEIKELRRRVSELTAVGQDAEKLIEDETSRTEEECMRDLHDVKEESECTLDSSEVFQNESGGETGSTNDDCGVPANQLAVQCRRDSTQHVRRSCVCVRFTPIALSFKKTS